MATKTDFVDITTTGPKALRGIRNPDLYNINPDNALDASLSDEEQEKMRAYAEQNIFRNYAANTGGHPYYPLEEGDIYTPRLTDLDAGNSRFDKGLHLNPSQEDINDERAYNEPWYAKVSAGIAKGAITAGTTFLDGTIGLIAGLGQVAVNYSEGKTGKEAWSGIWDNDFTNAMKSLTDAAEEALPNYYSRTEQATPWYHPSRIFSANFLGDTLLKQAGFTIGAAWSGAVYAELMKGIGLAKWIGALTKSTDAPRVITGLTGALMAAENEGAIEALNGADDWEKEQMLNLQARIAGEQKKALQEYQATQGQSFIQVDGVMKDAAMAKYEERIQKLEDVYNQNAAQIQREKALMGNKILLMNIPILTVSNWIQFGKMFAGGYGTNRKLLNLVGKPGEFAPQTSKKQVLWAFTKHALAEGNEELAQAMAQKASGIYFENDVNNFYRKSLDPEATDEVMSWATAIARGIVDTVGNPDSWEEFAVGAFMGALGVPGLRSMRTSTGGWQSPIIMKSGAIESYRELMDRRMEEQRNADILNQALTDPNYMSMLQNLIRTQGFQDEMIKALTRNKGSNLEEGGTGEKKEGKSEVGEREPGDERAYKDAEFGMLVSSVLAFDRTGKMDLLKEMIESAYDTSDERNYEKLIENSTVTKMIDGKEVSIGPFVDENGNRLSKEEVDKKVEAAKTSMYNAIDDVIKIKDEVNRLTGSAITGDQLDEMVWLKAQVNDWHRRANDMSGELNTILQKSIDVLELGKKDAEVQGKKEQAENLSKWIENLSLFRELPVGVVSDIFADKETTGQLMELLNTLRKMGVISEAEQLRADTILDDMAAFTKYSKKFADKYNEYLHNPEKHRVDHRAILAEADREYRQTKVDNFKEKAAKAKTTTELESIINSATDVGDGIKSTALMELEKEGNQIVKNYRESNQYKKEVEKELDNLAIDDMTREDALMLWDMHRYDQRRPDNVDGLANPNSEAITSFDEFREVLIDNGGESLSDEEIEDRYYEAKIALQQAMYNINNAKAFADRFPSEFKAAPVKLFNRRTHRVLTDGTTVDIDVLSDTRQEDADGEKIGEGVVTFGASIDGGELKENHKYGIRLSPDEVDWSMENVPETTPSMLDDLRKNEIYAIEFKMYDGNLRAIAYYKTDNGGTEAYFLKELINPYYLTREVVDSVESESGGEDSAPLPPVKILSEEEVRQLENDDSAVGDESADDIYKALEDDTNPEPNKNKGSKKSNEPKNYWPSVIPFYHIEQSKKKTGQKPDFRPFNVVAHELDNSVNFDTLYNYLVEKGAFDYIDSGKLNPHAKIGFIVDPDYETKKTDSKDKETPTIFMVDYESSSTDPQIIGVLGANSTYTAKYVGMQQLRDKVIEGYRKWEKEKIKIARVYISDTTTHVSKIMVGKIAYTDTDTELKNINGIFTYPDGSPKSPIFGVGKDNKIEVGRNTHLQSSKVRTPSSVKSGRLYMLVENGAGSYSPVAVRVKHFNAEEFEMRAGRPNVQDLKTNEIAHDIFLAIDAIARVKQQSELTGPNGKAAQLAKLIHMSDLDINYSEEGGNGPYLVFNLKLRDPETRELRTEVKDGKQVPVRDYTNVYFKDKDGKDKNVDTLIDEIIDVLYGFNFPIQVSRGSLNINDYNSRLINSGVLTSNLGGESGANVRGNWVTVNPLDSEGHEIEAVNPEGPERKQIKRSTTAGTEVFLKSENNKGYYVLNGVISDSEGNRINTSDISPLKAKLIRDLAYYRDNFENQTKKKRAGFYNRPYLIVERANGEREVLNVETQKYITNIDEKNKIIHDIDVFTSKSPQAQQNRLEGVMEKLSANQALVDKERGAKDGNYWINEDGKTDGQGNPVYVPYTRVHSVLGEHWKNSYDSVRTSLSEKADLGKIPYNNYLRWLERSYGVDLEEFNDVTTPESREKIINIIKGNSSTTATRAGTVIDDIVRQFFSKENQELAEPIINVPKDSPLLQKAYDALIDSLKEIRKSIADNGFTFYANNIVVFHKFNVNGKEVRIAGELDILAQDSNGNFYIYDIKTSKGNFYGKDNWYESTPDFKYQSDKDYYTWQLSAYKTLFESQYNVPVSGLGIIPFVLEYGKDAQAKNVVRIEQQKNPTPENKGKVILPVAYAPSVKMPANEFKPIVNKGRQDIATLGTGKKGEGTKQQDRKGPSLQEIKNRNKGKKKNQGNEDLEQLGTLGGNKKQGGEEDLTQIGVLSAKKPGTSNKGKEEKEKKEKGGAVDNGVKNVPSIESIFDGSIEDRAGVDQDISDDKDYYPELGLNQIIGYCEGVTRQQSESEPYDNKKPDGKVYKTMMEKLGDFGGVPVYVRTVPRYQTVSVTKSGTSVDYITSEGAQEDEVTMLDGHDYFIVLPNGRSMFALYTPDGNIPKSDDIQPLSKKEIIKTLKTAVEPIADQLADAIKKPTALHGERIVSQQRTANPDVGYVDSPIHNSNVVGKLRAQNKALRNGFNGKGRNYEETNGQSGNRNRMGSIIKANNTYTFNIVEKLFDSLLPIDRKGAMETRNLATRVFKVARQLGMNVRFGDLSMYSETGGKVLGRYDDSNTLSFDYDTFTSESDRQDLAEIMLHETIHAVTMYALDESMRGRLSGEMKEAVNELKEAYKELKHSGLARGTYAMRNVDEMVAGLANPDFRETLQSYRPSLWDRIVNAIKRLFGIKGNQSSPAYRRISSALDRILNNYDSTLYGQFITPASQNTDIAPRIVPAQVQKTVEGEWIDKRMPDATPDVRKRVVKGLVNVARRGELSWDRLDKALGNIGQISSSINQTALFENSFITAYNLLTTPMQRAEMAKELKNIKPEIGEGMPELVRSKLVLMSLFRNYTGSFNKTRFFESLGLGTETTSFLRELSDKVENWSELRPYTTQLYHSINNSISSPVRGNRISPAGVGINHSLPSFSKVEASVRELLEKKGYSQKEFNGLPAELKVIALDCAGF